MRSTVALTTLVVMVMCTGIHASAASDIGGFWYSDQTGITIAVETTYDGIKVRRTDQDRWRYYDEQRNDRFADVQGNVYTLRRRNQLEWRSRNGRNIMQFERRNTWYDPWEEPRPTAGNIDYGLGGMHPDGTYCPAGFIPHRAHKQLPRAELRRLRNLEGLWTDRYGTGVMQMRVNEKAVHVDINGRHYHFYPVGRSRLVSDDGVTLYTGTDNRLVWKPQRGRSVIFNRGRVSAYYCD